MRPLRRIGQGIASLGALVLSGALMLGGVALGARAQASSTTTLPTAVTTTTLSTSTILSAKRYANSMLDRAPLPPGSKQVANLSTSLAETGEGPADASVDSHRFFLVPSSLDVTSYLKGHLPKGDSINETGMGTAPGTSPVYDVGVSIPCVSRHITYCGLSYSMTVAKDGEQEMRVDAQVVWLPIVVVTMPVDGVVTVTGYGKISLMESSSDPTSVVLRHAQAVALRVAIETLKNTDGGMCMEDSQLLTITVSSVRGQKAGAVYWRATADECPGDLSVFGHESEALLDDRSCSFWHVVASFFAPGQADGTKSALKSCNDQA